MPKLLRYERVSVTPILCKSLTLSQSIADTIQEEATLPAAQIAALAELAMFAPDAFEQKSDVIVTHLVKRVLMVPSLADMVWMPTFICMRLNSHVYSTNITGGGKH